MNLSGYVNIQYWMVDGLGLRDKELMVYAVIYGFSQDGESEFTGGYSYIAKFFGWSRPTVKKAVDGLIEKGLINKRIEDINNVKFNRYSAVLNSLPSVKPLYGGSKESLRGGSKESLHNNKVLNKKVTKRDIDIADDKNELQKFRPNFNHRDEIVFNKEQHGMWIEQTYMKFRLRSKQLGPLLDQFTQELILKDKTHHNITEYKRHFLNWLLTQERVDKLKPHQR